MTSGGVKKHQIAEPELMLTNRLLLVVAAQAPHAIHAPLLLPNASVFVCRDPAKLYPVRVS